MEDQPVYVKLAKEGASFSDSESKFNIHGDQVKRVPKMTSLTKSWIMGGGLIVVDEEGTDLGLRAAQTAQVTSKSIGLGVKSSQPEEAKKQKPKKAEGGGEGEHELTLEELMNQK